MPTRRNRERERAEMNTEIQRILATVIKSDPALRGFTADDLPQAAKARIQNTLCSLERHLSSDDLRTLESWTGGNAVFDSAEAQFREGECCYYVFADESIYFRSSGDSEVWAFARDFADRLIINSDREFDAIDSGLLRHLGGHYADAVAERAQAS
jgi:hypothetical protein